MTNKFLYSLKKIWYYAKKPSIYLNSLNEKEEYIFINKIPGYRWYQFSIISRIIRFCAIVLVGTVFHTIWISSLIKLKYYDFSYMFNFLNKDILISIYGTSVFFSLIFLWLHCLFHVIIRIVFFKAIVKNNPLSIAQCISTVFKACRYTIGFFALTLGIPGVDYVFEANNNVAPLKGFYIKRHIQFFDANATNCSISEESTLSHKDILKKNINQLQNYTLYSETIAQNAYNTAQNAGMSRKETTEYVLEALRKR